MTVTSEQAAAALEFARAKVGAPYVLGGRGPDTFDCSGIITWAYRQVVPGVQFAIGAGHYSNDATIEVLYRWNYQQITADRLVPGDLLFLTDGTSDVTHGGMVISVDSDSVHFLNASSYYGSIVEDEWPLVGEKRGQRIVGYGRLLVSL